jgi:hypothetical protein
MKPRQYEILEAYELEDGTTMERSVVLGYNPGNAFLKHLFHPVHVKRDFQFCGHIECWNRFVWVDKLSLN